MILIKKVAQLESSLTANGGSGPGKTVKVEEAVYNEGGDFGWGECDD